MDVSTSIASAITSVGAALDMGRNLVGMRDAHITAAVAREFGEKLAAAQAHLLQIGAAANEQQGQISVLAERVRELEAHAAEKDRYRLAKLGVEREFFAYRLRPAAELVERADEVGHFVCQPCFESNKKVVLSGNGDGYWECPVCRHGAQVGVIAWDGGGVFVRGERGF